MTPHPERSPSTRPLTPDELRLQTSLLTDRDTRGIDELDTFITLQGMLMQKIELLVGGDQAQEEFDACDLLLVTVAKHFARTAQTESTREARASYAMELLMQTLARLDEICHQRGQMMTGPAAEVVRQQGTDELQQEITGKTHKEEFDILESVYGASCTRVVNSIL